MEKKCFTHLSRRRSDSVFLLLSFVRASDSIASACSWKHEKKEKNKKKSKSRLKRFLREQRELVVSARSSSADRRRFAPSENCNVVTFVNSRVC